MQPKKLFRGLGLSAVLLPAALLANAQSLPSNVPAALRAPAGSELVLQAHATGVQIYACTATAGQKPQWMLQGPEAVLRDAHGTVVAHHSAGPSWKHSDGSTVTGKALDHHDSPDGHSIPWLLLSVVSHDGDGVFAGVTTIQRLNTHGGEAPPARRCHSSEQKPVRIPYSADYFFYAAGAAAAH
jgi:Protein of unknown function (DUF3455)